MRNIVQNPRSVRSSRDFESFLIESNKPIIKATNVDSVNLLKTFDFVSFERKSNILFHQVEFNFNIA